MIAIKESIPITSPNHLELLTITLDLSITLCTVYVPPNSDEAYHNTLINYLEDLISMPNPVVIVGDFNTPDINWMSLTGSNHFSNSLCDLLFEHNLNQLVNYPTHIKENILDLALTNCDSVQNVRIFPQQYLPFPTDHFLISFDFHAWTPTNAKITPHFVFDFSMQG